MKTVKMTVGQTLVKFLNNQYIEFEGKVFLFVKGIFTLFGHGNVLGLGQALEEDRGHLEVYQGRNEQGMAHAAIGYAKQMNRLQIFACTSSIGPGAANMVTAAATATTNRIPLLLLPGDTYADRQPDPVLQQVEQFDEVGLSTNDTFRPVSRYWDRINRPEQLMTAMLNAMRVLTDPENTGAVTIALPQDVQGEVYEYPEEFLKKKIYRIERRPPTACMINDALALIKSKRKPLIICGGGVKYSGAGEVLKKFAEKFNIPIAETQAGKSAILSEHRLNLGGIGTTGNLAANKIANIADMVIGVGTRYTDFTTASKSIFQNEKVDFLNINICGFDAFKMDGMRITADARLALEILMAGLEKEKYKSGYINEIKSAKAEWEKELKRLYNIKYLPSKSFKPEIAGHSDSVLEEFRKKTGSCLTQTRAIGIINDLLGENDVIIGASGSLPGDLQRVWITKGINTYHMEYGYSCMGYEVNAALGVKLAVGKQREVYSMVGDAAYMMLHSELVTSIQEGLKINILLFDNAGFGCINNLQMDNGMNSFYTEFRYRNNKTRETDSEFIYTDFAKNAAAYGCITYTVKNEEELIKSLNDSKKQKVSTLIDIKVLPKTMTHGYESWWRVGLAQESKNKKIKTAVKEIKNVLKTVKQY